MEIKNLEKEIIDDIYIYKFIWEIDETNVDDIFQDIFETFAWKKIIFDLSKLKYWNSKFIWYLASLDENLENEWWKTCIIVSDNLIKEILEIAWINDIIAIKYTLEEAFAEVNKVKSKIN